MRINMTYKMVEYSSHDSPNKLDEHHGDEYSPKIIDTFRSFKSKIKICKANNDRIIHS